MAASSAMEIDLERETGTSRSNRFVRIRRAEDALGIRHSNSSTRKLPRFRDVEMMTVIEQDANRIFRSVQRRGSQQQLKWDRR